MDLNKYIEHTNLSPTITDRDIDQLVGEALEYAFYAVCVPPFWVKKAKRELGSADVKLVTVVGYPYGYNMAETKLEEIKKAMDDGADELDVMLNLSAFKSGMSWPKIEISKFAQLIHQKESIIKIIIETGYLDEEEIKSACKVCKNGGADFVVTSTDIGPEGANIKHLGLMKEVLSPQVGVKVSGGIESYEQSKVYLESGVDRIGTIFGLKIMNGLKIGN